MIFGSSGGREGGVIRAIIVLCFAIYIAMLGGPTGR